LYWLEDDIIEAKEMAFEDAIGHSAIEKYYGITGIHHENWQKVPVQIAKRINDGHMDKMAKCFGVASVRYDAKGNIKNEWWLNAQKFINDIKNVRWFDNHGEIKENWKIFDTYEAARSAAESAIRSAIRSARGSAAWSAARSAAESAIRSAAESAAESAASIISEDSIAIDFFNKVWEIWKSGYGYIWDNDGIFYVYKGF
jgi:hypothetical protein